MLKNDKLYYVGGVVRDEILGIPSLDVDLCYEGNAIEYATSEGLDIIRINPDFGTVRVLYDGKEVDIASTRSEEYPKKGKLPRVTKIGCPLKEDLIRRDFTVNAMVKRTTDGEIIDYFGGLSDIKNKTLRVLHKDSFIDDPTRIVRGLKFSVRFGFELDEVSKKMQDEYLQNINYDMSYHRLKKELKETFNLNKEEAFTRFVDSGIYKLLGKNQNIPEIKGSIEDLINNFNIDNPWIVYMGLFDLSNLELTSKEKIILDSVEKVSEIYSPPTESVMLYALKYDYSKGFDILNNKIKLEISGKDLMELGVPVGKIYKEILEYVYREKKKNPNLSREEEICLAKSLWKRQG